MLTDITCSVYN